jgi:anti-sigma factor RsiW
MNSCDDAVNILHNLDNELSGPKLETFRAHLQSCPTCKVRLEEERAFSIVLRRSRPLYRAPEQLRSQVSEILKQHLAAGDTGGSCERGLLRILQRPFPNRWPHLLSWGVLVTALMVAALFLSFVRGVVQRVRAASYVETAIAVHRGYLEGSLQPQIQSDSPTLVSAWFAGKVPFDFRLPAARDGNPVYRLAGARLVSYRGHDAALVIYEAQREKISLLVASNNYAAIAGGDEVGSANLVFHYFSREKFKVITWSNHGLSYALVSSLSASVRQSCLVCHQNMADRDVFRTRQ